LLFLYENLGDCLKENPKATLYYFTPALVVALLAYLMSFTASYANERAVLVLLVNFVIANIVLQLMLTNMAKRPFKLL
jgi:hypothetical protein